MVDAFKARWHRLLNGLWFVPSVIIVAFGLAGIGLTEFDKATGWDVGFLFSGDASAARTVLSTVAGSLITVAGLVFSLTVVVLQLASSQFSPRVLPNFLSDRITQATVGAFVGIFVFCLVALRSVGGPSNFVPRLTVTVTSILAIAAVVLLIVFIHHVSRLIQVSHTLRRLAASTQAQLGKLYPGAFGGVDHEDSRALLDEWRSQDDPAELRGAGPGYVTGILLENAARSVAHAEARLHLRVRPGDFVTERTLLGEVYPGEALDDECRRSLLDAIVVDSERDIVQDVQFGIRQLVDVALRAISPSVNDPTTAITCLGYVRSILEQLASRDLPTEVRRFDESGTVLVVERRTFDEHLAPLLEIGRYSAGDPRIVTAALDVCRAVVDVALEAGAGERAVAAARTARTIADQGRESARTDPDRAEIAGSLDRILRIAPAPLDLPA